jgi:hypothetical protein
MLMLDMVSAELWARHLETSEVGQASDRGKKRRSGASESAAASMMAKVMGNTPRKGLASAKAADTGPASAKAADTDGAGRARNGSPNLLDQPPAPAITTPKRSGPELTAGSPAGRGGGRASPGRAAAPSPARTTATPPRAAAPPGGAGRRGDAAATATPPRTSASPGRAGRRGDAAAQ